MLHLPIDWRQAIDLRAAEEGMSRLSYVRLLISESLTRRKVDHSPDDYGVFELKCRRKSDRLKQKRNEYQSRWRAKRRARRAAGLPSPGLSPPITWTFHPSGQITTSDLDLLATFVGIIDASGAFQPESTRYSKDRVIAELRKAFADRDFPDPRYRAFLDREGG